MSKLSFRKLLVLVVVCGCAVVMLAAPALSWAADEIVGKWQYTSDRRGETVTNTVTFSKNADGALVGKWSGRRGDSELSEVKIDGGKLTFVRSFTRGGGDEFKMTFTGSIEGNKLVGTFTTPRGEREVNLSRIQPPASLVGQWNLSMQTPDRDFDVKLTISGKADGSYTGEWSSEWGESPLTDIKYEEGKLSFTRKSDFQGEERVSTFTGKVEGHTMSGNMSSPWGEFTSTGTRFGAALIGKWELTSAGRNGEPRTRILTVKDDLTAKFQLREDNEVDVTELKIDGDQVTFKVIRRFGDREFPMEFKGKLAGTTLNGELITGRGSSEVTGKKSK